MFPSVRTKENGKNTRSKSNVNLEKRSNSFGVTSPLSRNKFTPKDILKINMGKTYAFGEEIKAEEKHVISNGSNINLKTKAQEFSDKKIQLIDKVKSLHPEKKQLIDAFLDVLTQNSVPDFYIYFAFLPLLQFDSQTVTSYLQSQITKTKNKESFYDKIQGLIKQREQCLQNLKSVLQKLKPVAASSIKMAIIEKKKYLITEISQMKTLTTQIIDLIKKWREQLKSLDERPVYITQNDKNILMEILNDNKFIFSSRLSEFINFGQKNDPFLLAPWKKQQFKNCSQFYSIIGSQADLQKFQSYMDYLGLQRSEQLPSRCQNIDPSQSQVTKIYSSVPQLPHHINVSYKEKQQRAQKTHNKIQQIRSVYERTGSKYVIKSDKKISIEDRVAKKNGNFGEQKNNHKAGHTHSQGKAEIQGGNQNGGGGGERMLRSVNGGKLEEGLMGQKQQNEQKEKKQLRKLQKQEKQYKRDEKKREKKSKSLINNPIGNEDKIIQDLKTMQHKLKSKLGSGESQGLLSDGNSKKQVNVKNKGIRRKSHHSVVSAKMQPMEKVQIVPPNRMNRNESLKEKKLQEEQMMEIMKMKMKKQMEQRLEQIKKEKLLESEALERKLKEQQEKFDKQKQMQVQLLLKLTKQKQQQQLQRIKKQVEQKQQYLKQQLQRQQKIRKEKQLQALREKQEKQKLIQELKKKEMREQVQEAVREELILQHRYQNQINRNKNNGNVALDQKSLQELQKEKQEQFMSELKQMQEKSKKQIIKSTEKSQIKNELPVIDSLLPQKQELLKQAEIQKLKLEKEMKQNFQRELQDNLKKIQQGKKLDRQEKQILEQEYRKKMSQKIQKQMRMQAIYKINKQLEDRQAKKIQMRAKLQKIKNNLQIDHQIDKEKIENEVKKQVIEKVIFNKNVQRQNAKLALRAQFQKQLFSTGVPQLYEPNDNFLLRKTEVLASQQYLNKKMLQRPTNQKPQLLQDQREEIKKHLKDIRKVVTQEQIQIYKKHLDLMKQNQLKLNQQNKNQNHNEEDEEYEEGYELVQPYKRQKEEEQEIYHLNISKVSKQKTQISNDTSKHKSKHKKSKKKLQKQQSENDSEDNSFTEISARNKRITSRQSEINDKREQNKKSTKKYSEKGEERKHLGNNSKIKSSPRQSKIGVQPVTVIKSKAGPLALKQMKPVFDISLDAIPEDELDIFLESHLRGLDPLQLQIQTDSRQQLYEKLSKELTFCIILAHFEGQQVGLALAYHDRMVPQTRKFVIAHMGTYRPQHLHQFILDVSKYIFLKDPCDEIQFNYQFRETSLQQSQFKNQFEKWFANYGTVFQKKIDDSNVARKYHIKRQFNHKCQVNLGGVLKNKFNRIFQVDFGVLMAETDMVVHKDQIRDVICPENQVSYSILIAEIFRNYLSVEEAEALKNKVKEITKLRQLLIMVVLLQKKKFKLQELKISQFKSMIELNMKLMSQGRDMIKYCKDTGLQNNTLYFCQFNQAFNMPFNFQTTTLPLEGKQGRIEHVSYFRLSPLSPYKLHIIKSSLYNNEMNILPTQNSKYKIFLMNAQQYLQLCENTKIDLYSYLHLLLKNVKSYNVAAWNYVWMPQLSDAGAWQIREFSSFLSKPLFCHDNLSISYRQFLPGGLIIQPTHRDLVLSAPFIVGVLNMNMQQICEGAPVYARVVSGQGVRVLQVQ